MRVFIAFLQGEDSSESLGTALECQGIYAVSLSEHRLFRYVCRIFGSHQQNWQSHPGRIDLRAADVFPVYHCKLSDLSAGAVGYEEILITFTNNNK